MFIFCKMDYDYIHYNSFFYNCLCHVCKKADKNIKRCSVCKAVAYCSKEHQANDWWLHRTLCKIISKTNKTLSTDGIKNFNDYKNFRVRTSVLWKDKLGRKLNYFEEQIWMFPRICVVCFSKNVITECENCLNVLYCSEGHKNIHKAEHSNFCDALRLCMEIDLYYFYEKPRPSEINVKVFEEKIKKLPSNLKELMALYDSTIVNTLDKEIQFIIKSDLVAPAATILFGLEKSGLIHDRMFPKETLSVHIVGADLTEMSWLWEIITELPFHWLKNIHVLDYFVIGPEICHNGITTKFAEQLCENCKERKPVTNIIFHSQLYHEVIPALKKPDVIVAFNSGLHEFHNSIEADSWKNSINCLVKYSDVPLILTAYTLEEIKQDVNIVKGSSKKYIKTILEPQRNPFSNMRPIRDWETENVPVFYLNGYIAILSAVT